ncbi:MAG: STT3 domain-containing protein, partial [Methanosarcinales archaeon]
VIMAITIVIATYFLTEKIYDEASALISALFVGIFPFFVFRTTLGLFDNDSIALLLALINLLAYINFSTEKKDLPWILVGILSVASLVYTWHGAFIYISIFAIFLFYYEINRDKLVYLLCISALFIILSYSAQYRYVEYSLLSGTLAILLGLGKYTLLKYPRYEKPTYLIGLLLLLFMFFLFSRTGVSAWEATTARISELRPLGIDEAWDKFSLFIFLFPLGFIVSLRNEKYAIPAWSLYFLFAFMYIRGLIFSFVPIAILSAYSITSTLKNVNYRAIATIFVTLTVIFLTYPPIDAFTMQNIESLSDAMKFLRENTEEDSIVLANWDYGHAISGIGQRKCVVSGSATKLAQNVAEILFNPYSNSSKKRLENLGTDYVMVDATLAIGKYRSYKFMNETDIFFYPCKVSGRLGDSIVYGKNEISFNTKTNEAYLHINNRKLEISDVIVKTPEGNKVYSYRGAYRGAVFVSKNVAMLMSSRTFILL